MQGKLYGQNQGGGLKLNGTIKEVYAEENVAKGDLLEYIGNKVRKTRTNQFVGVAKSGGIAGALLNMWTLGESSAIPGYTVLDSIYANGNQYAIIDYYANQNTKVEMKFTHNNNAEWPSNLFASRTSNTSNMFSFLPYEGGSKKTRSSFGTQNIDFTLVPANTDHIVIKDGKYTYIDGELKATHTEQTFTSTNPMYILWQPSSSSTKLEARIYYIKIWDNGTLIHDLIPALNDETEIAGLYDLITKEFITSATSTEFYAIYKTPETNYVESGLYANYMGTNSMPNKWFDAVNAKHITMYNNPVYDKDIKGWTFGNANKQYGKATLTAPTGDFTIEIYGSLPEKLSTTKLVAMFGGIWSYYKGYGLLSVFSSDSQRLSAFIATATDSSTTTYMDIPDLLAANTKTKFVVRRKKETGEHTIYAKNKNGERSHTEIRTTASLGSNPENQFVIATQKPESTTNTDFGKGTYFAVRVYNRYLTDEEIAQNHAEDIRIYGA